MRFLKYFLQTKLNICTITYCVKYHANIHTYKNFCTKMHERKKCTISRQIGTLSTSTLTKNRISTALYRSVVPSQENRPIQGKKHQTLQPVNEDSQKKHFYKEKMFLFILGRKWENDFFKKNSQQLVPRKSNSIFCYLCSLCGEHGECWQ